jgi:hypothetical protein
MSETRTQEEIDHEKKLSNWIEVQYIKYVRGDLTKRQRKILEQPLNNGQSLIGDMRERFRERDPNFEKLLLLCNDSTRKIVKDLGYKWC